MLQEKPYFRHIEKYLYIKVSLALSAFSICSPSLSLTSCDICHIQTTKLLGGEF